MDTRWIAALACGAALLLGACSSDNAAGPPAGGVGEPDSGGTDPGSDRSGTGPDGGGADPDAGGAEPTALERAYEAANAAVLAATGAANTAAATNTQAARDRALELIVDARGKLDEVVGAARDALAAAEGSAERGAATRARDAAIEYKAEQARILDRAHGSTGWAGRSAVAAEIPYPSSTVDAVRNPRRTADGSDAATLLKAADFPPVPYEDGKIMMAAGMAGSGDRFRMRGIPAVRASVVTGSDTRRFLIYNADNATPYQWVDPSGGGNDGVEPKTVAGLKIARDGLVVDIGGKGASGVDLRHSDNFRTAYVRNDGSNGGYDLKLTFGRPAASPEGNAEHYWTAALMPGTEHLAAHGAILKDGERTLPLGVYRMRLSNHVGLDRNLEDPDAEPGANARDDVNSYLSYAAYGVMEFDVGDLSGGIAKVDRIFPFHAGYDAFRDEAETRTTDIAAADRITGGTFKGRTIASQFGLSPSVGFPVLSGANFLRLRGDVELTATISRTGSDNKIRGKIKNLEQWDAKGYWEDYGGIAGELALREGDIGASGSFAGVIDTGSLAAFAEGGYRGNFYGPHDDLEAAGIWYLQDGVAADSEAQNLSIVGSFGAALVRPDGSYGMQVGTDAAN